MPWLFQRRPHIVRSHRTDGPRVRSRASARQARRCAQRDRPRAACRNRDNPDSAMVGTSGSQDRSRCGPVVANATSCRLRSAPSTDGMVANQQSTLSAEQILQRLAAAAIGDRQHPGARLQVERQSGEMRRGANADGRVAHGIELASAHNAANSATVCRLSAGRTTRTLAVAPIGATATMIAAELHRQIGKQRLVHRQRIGADEEGVTIRVGARHRLRRDIARRAGAVLHHHVAGQVDR